MRSSAATEIKSAGRQYLSGIRRMLSIFETSFEKCERMWEGEPNAAPRSVIPSAAVPSLLQRTLQSNFCSRSDEIVGHQTLVLVTFIWRPWGGPSLLIYSYTRDFTHIRYEQYGLSYLDLWTLPAIWSRSRAQRIRIAFSNNNRKGIKGMKGNRNVGTKDAFLRYQASMTLGERAL